MGAGDDILKKLEELALRFDAIELKIDKALERTRMQSVGASAAPSSSGGIDPLPDHQLDNAWADKEIKKDPPRYSGPSMVGRRYSEASSEWLDAQSSFMNWKAGKGREENPVRLKNDGKPWHLSDTFESKLCAAWSRRNASKPLSAVDTAGDGFGGQSNGASGGGFSVDDLPFATCGDVAPHLPPWEHW